MQLKKEHGDGKHVEHGGLQQRTLLRILDALDDAVIAVNESEEIRFCNRAGENLLRYSADDLCERLIWSIFCARSVKVLRPLLCVASSGVPGQEESQPVLRVGLERGDGNNCYVNVQVVALRHESNTYYLFILKDPGNVSGFIGKRWGDTSHRVGEELAMIQMRMKGLVDILSGMLSEPTVESGKIFFGLSEINRSLARFNLLLQLSPYPPNDRRFLAVKVMNICIEYWTECRGADKFDLARDSKLWTVYINPDGWERTQTLDKYFDVNTLPKRPNWKKILATANFVLNSCFDPSDLRKTLEIFLEQLHFSVDV